MNVMQPGTDHKRAERLSIIDCDIHPALKSLRDYDPFLEGRWRAHLAEYGDFSREPFSDTIQYPRMAPAISRADAWPPNGGPPGSDLQFMRDHHLDPMGVEYGVLVPLLARANNQRNLDFAAAMARAANRWQEAEWLDRDARLRGSIVVSHEHPEAAVEEIARCARDRRFVQILLPPRSTEPLGRRRYWPLYQAAVEHDLPIALHIGGTAGHPPTASGWVSYYFEEHHSNVQTMQTLTTSLVVEGVFERFPTLRVVLIESSSAWVPPLCWRLDAHWRRLKSEVPHLKLAPSEYIRRNIWFTTQPIDEPERNKDLARIIDWVGLDRLFFATDYPHWDFDDPRFVFKGTLSRDAAARIYRDNARAFYKLD
jgi:uncharacterized protein